MTEPGPLVLLGGEMAMALAARLEASGYCTAPLPPMESSETADDAAPAAVLLSPSEDQRIPALRQRWGRVPILLGSPQDDIEARCQALGRGADDLWLSQAGPSDLLTRLRLHLKLGASARSDGTPTITVGDLEVDPQQQTVVRGGSPLSLTAREFQLLLLLLRHSPDVVSREQIFREIWPEERTAGSNVIEVYVRYLRRKLEAADQPRLIHTVRGQGYCLRK